MDEAEESPPKKNIHREIQVEIEKKEIFGNSGRDFPLRGYENNSSKLKFNKRCVIYE